MGRTNETEAGDEFLTKQEAAQVLQKSPRSIFRYMEKGWLKPVTRGPYIGVTRSSVYSLRDELEKEVNPYLVSIARLEARTMILESRVAAMMRLLNLKNQPLALTDPEASSLYAMIDYKAKNGWTPHDEETMIDTFMRMDDKNIEQLEKVTGDPHPWRPLLMLAGTMKHAMFDRRLQIDIDLAAAHLDVLAQVWCRRKGETVKVMELMSARDAAPLKKLINRMERDRLKIRTAGEA